MSLYLSTRAELTHCRLNWRSFGVKWMSMAYVGFSDTTYKALTESTKIASPLPVAFVGFWLTFRHVDVKVRISQPVMAAN